MLVFLLMKGGVVELAQVQRRFVALGGTTSFGEFASPAVGQLVSETLIRMPFAGRTPHIGRVQGSDSHHTLCMILLYCP